MQRQSRRRVSRLAVVGAVLILALSAGAVLALTLGYADGTWSNAVSYGGAGVPVSCLAYGADNSSATPQNQTTVDENQVRYGRPADNNPDNCTPFSNQSGFGFNGSDGVPNFNPGEQFLLGVFTHYNNEIYLNRGDAADRLRTVGLAVALNFTDPVLNETLNYTVQLDETPNEAYPCAYGNEGGRGCNDRVTFPTAIGDETFTIDGVEYTLQITGFVDNGESASCPAAPAGAPATQFITGEDSLSRACLYARIVLKVDFGDAPNGPTLMANDGARHTITAAGPYLGNAKPDGENDGQPHASAAGDDLTVPDDEDGIVLVGPGIWSGPEGGKVTVLVNKGAAPRACVYGWVDWAGDGFGVGDDSTAQGFVTSSGNLELTFADNLPDPGSYPSAAFLRLRVLSGTDACPALGAGGLAADGEVEDHLLSFGPNAVSLAGFAAVPAFAWPAAGGLFTAVGLAGAGVTRIIRRRPRK